ncbi:Piwi-domain-containing protein [Daldinia eschscholtzii]|nr:Piwi-domain-containing protein [Daldinia eschscholtzii]
MSRRGQYAGSNQSPWSKPTHDTEIEKSENSTVENIKAKKQAQNLPSRPNYGKGVPIMLWTNYVAMSVGNLSLHRYNVTISPESSVRMHIQVIKLFLQLPSMVQYMRGIIADSRSILLSQKKIELPNDSCKIVYRAEDEVQPRMNAKHYTITVKFERILSISNLQDYADSPDISTIDNIKNDIVQALNILFSHYADTTNSLTTSGSRKTFPVSTSVGNYDLSGGLEVMMGYFTSVRWIISRFLLNINVCRATFYKPKRLVELIKEYREVDGFHLKLALFLKGLRVRVDHLHKASKNDQFASIIRTTWGLPTERDGEKLEHRPEVPGFGAAPKEVKFWMESKGSYISVYDYFDEKYRIKSESDFVTNVGSSDKPTYLVPDVCTVLPGQVARTKLTLQQSQRMIDFCTGGPSKDIRNIQETGLASVGLRGNNRTLLPTRRSPPESNYCSCSYFRSPKNFLSQKTPLLSIDKRSWDLRQVHFMKTPGMGRWACVILEESDQETPFTESKDRKDLGAAFKHAVTNVGIRYTEPVNLGVHFTVTARGVEDIKRFFKTAIAHKLNWLLLILPRRMPAVIYNSIKKVGDLDSGFGITTICIDGDKLYEAKSPAQYLANVSMKLNLKLGGNNQFVKFQEFSSLNFGKTMIVGIDVTHPSPSSDKNAPSIAAMPAVIQRQTRARQEMVSKLSDMLKSRLELWNKANKAYPENIIVYRGGVSEVPSNPGPGTVVDRGVTEARYWDFYLQSHYAIKGTARPIHYFVVRDEIFREMENAVIELEGLTQGLCYMFGRATMSVSVCTPAYYADIAFERARCYLDGLFDNPGQWQAMAVDQSKIPSNLGIKLHANIRDTMFYI